MTYFRLCTQCMISITDSVEPWEFSGCCRCLVNGQDPVYCQLGAIRIFHSSLKTWETGIIVTCSTVRSSGGKSRVVGLQAVRFPSSQREYSRWSRWNGMGKKGDWAFFLVRKDLACSYPCIFSMYALGYCTWWRSDSVSWRATWDACVRHPIFIFFSV